MRLIRDGEKGGRGYGCGGRGRLLYLSLRCHHQNDSCIKLGSDENHFNVSLIVRDKVTRQCPQTTILEVKGEPKRIRTEVPLLTGLPPYHLTARPNRLTSLGQRPLFFILHRLSATVCVRSSNTFTSFKLSLTSQLFKLSY